MKSPVLQTLPICEQHISTCLAEKLKEGVSEWKLERPGRSIALKSDKCCKCSQWSWSTCAQQSARCPDSWQQSERLWSFFHCNTTAAYILETSRWCWMYQIDGDISAVREIKDAVRKNLQNRCSDPKFWDFLKKCLIKGSGPFHAWLVPDPERTYDHLRGCAQQGTLQRSVFSPDNVDKLHFSEKKILVKREE